MDTSKHGNTLASMENMETYRDSAVGELNSV